MAFSEEETVAELAVLRVAVRQLIEATNLQSIGGVFAANALKKGLAELDQRGVPEHEKARFRTLAQASYRDLFSGL
jgi:hypothetical protein